MTAWQKGCDWLNAVSAPGRRAGRWGFWTAADLIFPPRCVPCGKEITGPNRVMICDDCREQFVPEPWHVCERCGGCVDGEAAAGLARQGDCHYCRRVRLRFEAVVSLGPYEGALRLAVLAMKNDRREILACQVGRLFWEQRTAALESAQADVVVPIPSHWVQRFARGTNCPDHIAGEVGSLLGVDVDRRLLHVRRRTRPQKGLSRMRRFQNVRGAFGVTSGYVIAGARVLLVDDILTTGATCSEAASVLKQAGASRVVVAVVARADERKA